MIKLSRGFVYRCVAALFCASSMAACAAAPDVEGEDVGEIGEALHNATCLDVSADSINSTSVMGSDPDDCDVGSESRGIGTNTYGTTSCPKQYQVQWSISSSLDYVYPRVNYAGDALDSITCPYANLFATTWGYKISTSAWVRLADTELVGTWSGSVCNFGVTGPSWVPMPNSVDAQTYSSIRVTAAATLVFQQRPVTVTLYRKEFCN